MSIYAVNGKEPVAAWIPSLDTAGNGTATLTDLTGNGYTGTLIGMDAATDWVADTGAGGSRALDFNGAAQRVAAANSAGLNFTGDYTFSAWVYPRASSGTILSHRTGGTTYDWSINASRKLEIFQGGVFPSSATALNLNSWSHVSISFTPNVVSFFLNGVIDGTATINSPLGTSVQFLIGVWNNNARGFNGRMDDIRVFDQPLDATDVADLYASGLGRGITFGTANPTGNPTGNLNNAHRQTRHAL